MFWEEPHDKAYSQHTCADTSLMVKPESSVAGIAGVSEEHISDDDERGPASSLCVHIVQMSLMLEGPEAKKMQNQCFGFGRGARGNAHSRGLHW